MEKSYFDGRAFEDMGLVVERVHDPIPEMREEMQAKTNRHGSYLDSLTMSPREITLECRYLGDEWQDFDDMMDELAAWLITEDERPLVLRTRAGQHYMAHFSSYSEGDREGGSGIGGFELTFVASDPVRYGEDRALIVKNGGSKTFDVGGTERADLVVDVRNAVRSDKYVAVSFTRGTETSVLRVAPPDGAAHSIRLDAANRATTVDGSVSGITLDSDWPDFKPGRWTVSVSEGTGTATLSWTQRYR